MRQLIAGNWKMHGTGGSAVALAEAVLAGAGAVDCDLLVCPPSVHLGAVAEVLRGGAVALGGQDCHQALQGAHTGDIAAPMLLDVGATHVILGHSERRQNHGEIDEVVREKTETALRTGLTPIVCVGETDEQRQSGQETEVVGWQLAGSLPQGFVAKGVGCAVAYEPCWAIGTGKTADSRGGRGDARLHPRGIGSPVRRGGQRHPHPVWRLGEPGQRAGPAGDPPCRRCAGGRREPEGAGFPGDCRIGA